MSSEIPFREFMFSWLYDVNHGYYTCNNVGKKGDFYTSVSVSKFFGGAISRFVLKLLELKKLSLPLCIVEIGSNNGDLIADIAEFLSAFNCDIFKQTTFCVIEPLSTLKVLQKQTFSGRITKRFGKELQVFQSFKSFSKSLETAEPYIFFVSNELFDSMPCDLVLEGNMLYYDSKCSQFAWKSICDKVEAFQEAYQAKGAEVATSWESFVQSLMQDVCKKWFFLTFDYGDFFSRDMNLRIYKQHQVYNFYEELQKEMLMQYYRVSDITYDVDFSVIQNIFQVHGATVECCMTQAKFLIEECEILDIFESFSSRFNVNMLVKQRSSLQGLIMPNAMGERFKALCVSSL